jgi:hypothetical protein
MKISSVVLLKRGLGLQQIPTHRGGANSLISEQNTLKLKLAVLWIRMFLDLQDPEPSMIKQT